jgi:hypothetical protein
MEAGQPRRSELSKTKNPKVFRGTYIAGGATVRSILQTCNQLVAFMKYFAYELLVKHHSCYTKPVAAWPKSDPVTLMSATAT